MVLAFHLLGSLTHPSGCHDLVSFCRTFKTLPVFLALALGLLLIVGETLEARRLAGLTFLIYWLGCFLFTGLAILVAILDLAVTRRRARAEEQALVTSTLDKIAREKQSQNDTSANR